MILTSNMTARETYNLIVATERATRFNYVSLGKLLKNIKEDDEYLSAVGGIETWNQFLKQPEIGLSVYQANKLIDIYETFVEKLHVSEQYLSEISLPNIKRLLPVVKNLLENTEDKIPLDELLEQARMLSDKDFKSVLVENKEEYGDQPRTYTYMIMRKCVETNNMSKVYDIPQNEIVSLINKYTK